jgi:hypothetical protein
MPVARRAAGLIGPTETHCLSEQKVISKKLLARPGRSRGMDVDL